MRHMNTTGKLIHGMGGPVKVGQRIGFSPQRVSNWIARDRIPLQVRVDHPDLFPLPPPKPPASVPASASQD